MTQRRKYTGSWYPFEDSRGTGGRIRGRIAFDRAALQRVFGGFCKPRFHHVSFRICHVKNDVGNQSMGYKNSRVHALNDGQAFWESVSPCCAQANQNGLKTLTAPSSSHSYDAAFNDPSACGMFPALICATPWAKESG